MRVDIAHLSTLKGVMLLCALIIATVVVPVLVIFRQGSATLRRAADDQMELRLASAKESTEAAMSELLQRLEGLAVQPVMVRILDRDVDHEIDGSLRASVGGQQRLKRVAIMNASGLLIASAGQVEGAIATGEVMAQLQAAGPDTRAVIVL